ncbi:MAG TPA: copper homeostasis protein CutC [Bacteroidia bacterium]|nr:copper homeostasis protein CutC [Bacteroidia bacterium]
MNALLEIACFSPMGAMAANGPACDRLELCSNYAVGGLTPSHGYLEFIRKKTEKDLFVMIRAVSGFSSRSITDDEVMRDDILFCKKAGMNGIVTGMLLPNKNIDKDFIRRSVETAYPLPVTFHRAFDECPDPFAAMETLIDCGVKRILTSGGKKNAEDGIPMLKELITKAAGRIIIVPGGGVSILNAKKIAEQTGCTEIHSSAKGASEAGYDEITPDYQLIVEMKKQLSQVQL